TVSGTAPSGYTFVGCDVNQTPSQDTVVVPAGGSGTGILYVALIPETPTQTLSGHIYDCTSGTATTTEVTGGTLSATGPTTVASHANPLPATSVDAGSYTLTGTAPAGYTFVGCDVNHTPNEDHVAVPAGGSGTGALYVALIPTTPTQTLSGVIELCNTDMA